MPTVESQVSIRVAGEQDGAEVDFECDGLNSTVHTDISLRWKKHTNKFIEYISKVSFVCKWNI